MALLNSGESVKEQFLRSVRSAIENNVIDPEQLRMLVVSPTEDRSALSVHFSNEYEDFLDLEYLETDSIGHIDISPWLDACDKLDPASIAALNSAEQLRLAEMQQRYRQTPPAISMDTIPEGPWRQRLELLREEMISEVESGLSHTVFRKGGYGSTG
ncbi:MAG: hypothetical protein CMN76_20245 [Spirochaetaceae bacterium]|mgnify:FL=1|nr:hypothetical protein [Spirochaetaceae bacterium]|tara:strand:- start:2381 stop:2851 length:471 start_codon:yes stop_codon:yes gene_type:complete